MATSMKSTMKVEVTGAGTSSATHIVEAEAYDKIEVTVPTGGTALTVEVHTGAATQIDLLFITADEYSDDPTLPLSYTPGSGTPVILDAPQLFLGAGAVGLLGGVTSIDFKNETAADVDVQILVGRDATTA